MTWLLLAAVVPVGLLAMAMLDSVRRFQAEQKVRELKQVCEVCSKQVCTFQGCRIVTRA